MRVLILSCNTGQGHNAAGKAIQETFAGRGIECQMMDALLLAGERQLAAAKEAQSALADALAALEGGMTLDAAGVCVDDALNALYQLTGERAGDDVIDEVFSTFCVGK